MLLTLITLSLCAPSGDGADVATLNRRDVGYRGIWYANQKSGDEYVYKYSGGLGTYCAKHSPFAIYAEEAEKTFFCYGGTTQESHRRLLHMVSYFDHRTGLVPRPLIVLDKQTSDAHDNPVLSIDSDGYLWLFSTSHGRARPSFVHRSKEPYSIDSFERVEVTYETADGRRVPMTNFSYMQAWYLEGRGFVCFFTRYGDPAARTNMFMTSVDGVEWSSWQRLAAIEKGHYQVSGTDGLKVASMFNFHPQDKGLNWRTNLYYLESTDFGETWSDVQGNGVDLPLTTVSSSCLVHDYRDEGLKVYLKDLAFDAEGRPILLFITSPGYESGPVNDPRTWTLAVWQGARWSIHPITTSDNNYDMGSLVLEEDRWMVIGPTEPGPQRYNPGGEVARWVSTDRGRTWSQERRLTLESERNHTYVRRALKAHPDFQVFWADGHGREPSLSRLYFANRDGAVFMLPPSMSGSHAEPIEVAPTQTDR